MFKLSNNHEDGSHNKYDINTNHVAAVVASQTAAGWLQDILYLLTAQRVAVESNGDTEVDNALYSEMSKQLLQSAQTHVKWRSNAFYSQNSNGSNFTLKHEI